MSTCRKLKFRPSAICATVVLVLCAANALPTIALETDADVVAQLRRQMEEMQAELALLRTQVESPEVSSPFQFASQRTEVDLFDVDCQCETICQNSCGETFFSAELVVLQPFFEDGTEVPRPGFFAEPESGFNPSLRIVGGFRNCNGLGLRARYWTYDGYFSIDDQNPPPTINSFDLEVDVVDVEVTQLVDWGWMLADISGGFRYSRFDTFTATTNPIGVPRALATRARTSHFGPTVAMEGLVPVCGSCYSLVGNFRASMMFGNSNVEDITLQPNTLLDAEVNNDVFSYSIETQLGIQYGWCLQNCSTLTVRALAEAQVWNNATHAGDTGDLFGSFNTDNEIGFFGGTLSVIYAR